MTSMFLRQIKTIMDSAAHTEETRKPGTGAHKTILNAQNKAEVLRAIMGGQKRIRQIMQETGLSKNCVQRIVRYWLADGEISTKRYHTRGYHFSEYYPVRTS